MFESSLVRLGITDSTSWNKTFSMNHRKDRKGNTM